MALSPLRPSAARGPSALRGAAPLAAQRAAAPALEAPLGPTSGPARAQGALGSQPSVLAGLVRPAVLAVVLGLGIGAAAPSLAAEARQGAPLAGQRAEAGASLNASLQQGLARILAADADGDGVVRGGREPETAALDPLARAIYAYVDQVNPRGNYSLWGQSSRGDYLVGGLGLGHALRPAHMTSQQILTRQDLQQGVRELERALTVPRAGVLADDLAAVLARGKDGAAPTLDEVHRAATRLLEQVQSAVQAKELATLRETVVLFPHELLARLEPGSLERTIAEVTMGHGKTFYARELERFRGGRSGHDEGTIVGDAQQLYILQLAKAAREDALLADVRAALPR
jgi:hypothetical protein